jgi:signal transduction histidine kinase
MHPAETSPQCLSQKRLLEIFDAAADAILVVDNHGRILAANAAARAMAEMDPVGQSEGSFLSLATDNQGCQAWFGPRRIPVDINITSEAAGTMVCLARDVRHRLESERQTRARECAEGANRAKGIFLANMSHEIRTPLNGILSMANLLGASAIHDEQRTGLDIIRSSGESLLRIVDDIIDYSKIEAGKLSLEEVNIELRDLLDNVVSLYALNAQNKGVDIHALISPLLPHSVRGDPLRLRQVIGNLLSNAVKFTASGEVSLTVLPGSHADEIRFEIRDSGIGISEEAISRLFQAFEQADGSTTRRFGGTGLGLSICKSLVELMAGRIWVTSDPGKGSCFGFEVKLKSLGIPAPSPAQKLGIYLHGGSELIRRSCNMPGTTSLRSSTAPKSSSISTNSFLILNFFEKTIRICA